MQKNRDNARWLNSRQIVKRVVVEGDLVLETPASFGNGDREGLVDLALAVDPLEGRALLTGTTLAGALRGYLQVREHGYWEDKSPSLYTQVFGMQEGDEGEQSLLITYDALGGAPRTELRDGVAIDPRTRTAEDRKKYDLELLEAGTVFPIKVELLVQKDRQGDLLKGLVIALQGLERGEIALGARKRRGFGQCRVNEWRVRQYDLTTPEGLTGWLENDQSGEARGPAISKLVHAQGVDLDERSTFTLEATFGLDSSLLIRSASGEADAPDMVHLRSNRDGHPVPVLSGTSLAGALRARALRIAKTLSKGKNENKAQEMIDALFGRRLEMEKEQPADAEKTKPTASHLVTGESVIEHPLDLVQSRVKIDRFTGGAFPTALFTEQPVFGCDGTRMSIQVSIQQPSTAQIGLLLLLLKDLWTGDLPLGGESSVGRGRLRGQQVTLTYKKPNVKTPDTWSIAQLEGDQLQITGDQKALEAFVCAFKKEVRG